MFEILNRGLLRVSGADAQILLQRLITNDIIKNNFSYNYLLNNLGRYVSDFFIIKQSPESFFVDIAKSNIDVLMKKLNFYKLRSQVLVENISDNYTVIYSRNRFSPSIFSYQDPRFSELGYRSIIEIKQENVNLTQCDNLYLNDKYKYFIPDGNIDLAYEKSIILEFGAGELNGIDYTKGCFIGQEVMARAKYQGNIRKKIFGLSFDSNVENLEKDTEIYDINNNKIGKICSYYSNRAIALLREELVTNNNVKILEHEATVTVPIWRYTSLITRIDASN